MDSRFPRMGYIYILKNQWTPHALKLGVTFSAPTASKESILSTGEIGLWELYHAWLVPNPAEVERRILASFNDLRINEGNNYLAMSPEDGANKFHQTLLAWGIADKSDPPPNLVDHQVFEKISSTEIDPANSEKEFAIQMKSERKKARSKWRSMVFEERRKIALESSKVKHEEYLAKRSEEEEVLQRNEELRVKKLANRKIQTELQQKRAEVKKRYKLEQEPLKLIEQAFRRKGVLAGTIYPETKEEYRLLGWEWRH